MLGLGQLELASWVGPRAVVDLPTEEAEVTISTKSRSLIIVIISPRLKSVDHHPTRCNENHVKPIIIDEIHGPCMHRARAGRYSQ